MGRKKGRGIKIISVACTCLLFNYIPACFIPPGSLKLTNSPVIWRENTTLIITVSQISNFKLIISHPNKTSSDCLLSYLGLLYQH